MLFLKAAVQSLTLVQTQSLGGALDLPLFRNPHIQPSRPGPSFHHHLPNSFLPPTGASCLCSCSRQASFNTTARRILLESKSAHSPSHPLPAKGPLMHVRFIKKKTQNPHHGPKAPHHLFSVDSWPHLFPLLARLPPAHRLSICLNPPSSLLTNTASLPFLFS